MLTNCDAVDVFPPEPLSDAAPPLNSPSFEERRSPTKAIGRALHGSIHAVPELDHLLLWVRDLAAARSTTHRSITGGDAFANASFPDAHDHNFVLFRSELAVAEAEEFFARQGITHRLIEAHENLVPELATRLPDHERSTDVLMSWTGGHVPPSSFAVEELDMAERCVVAEDGWRTSMPAAVARQLGRRAETLAGTCEATFLGVRDATGRVVSRLDLYVADGVAQLEELVTDPASRRRGMGTALLYEGLRRTAGNAVFLIAEDGSPPAAMYRLLGFKDVGTKESFTRL